MQQQAKGDRAQVDKRRPHHPEVRDFRHRACLRLIAAIIACHGFPRCVGEGSDRADMWTALVKWVENGTALEKIITTKLVDALENLEVSRYGGLSQMEPRPQLLRWSCAGRR